MGHSPEEHIMPLLSSLDSAREEGLRQGIKQGMQEGRQEGRQENMQEVIDAMLREKADIGFICKVTGLSKREIKKLQNGN